MKVHIEIATAVGLIEFDDVYVSKAEAVEFIREKINQGELFNVNGDLFYIKPIAVIYIKVSEAVETNEEILADLLAAGADVTPVLNLDTPIEFIHPTKYLGVNVYLKGYKMLYNDDTVYYLPVTIDGAPAGQAMGELGLAELIKDYHHRQIAAVPNYPKYYTWLNNACNSAIDTEEAVVYLIDYITTARAEKPYKANTKTAKAYPGWKENANAGE